MPRADGRSTWASSSKIYRICRRSTPRGLRLECFHGLQYGLDVPVHLHVVPATRDDTVGSDEVSRARETHETLPVHALLFPRTVPLRHLVIRVDEEGKVQLVLPGKLGLALGIEDAHPQHGHLALLEIRQRVAEGAGFARAAGRIVLRVEIEHHGPARVVLESVRLAALILERKCGGVTAGLDGRHGKPPDPVEVYRLPS